MQLNPSEISELIKSKIEKLDLKTEARNEGTIISLTDGIVRIHGLEDVMSYEMLEFPGNTFGLALNLERDSVGAVVLGEYTHLAEGDSVAPVGLVVVHQAAGGPSALRLLPIPDPPARERAQPYPVLLNLPPAGFFAALTDQYLYAALQSALYESLLQESQTRLAHMEQAIRKLQDDLDALGRRRNRLRQEEITEEIEVILLNAAAPTSTTRASRAPAPGS